jgi:hypothetical protein
MAFRQPSRSNLQALLRRTFHRTIQFHRSLQYWEFQSQLHVTPSFLQSKEHPQPVLFLFTQKRLCFLAIREHEARNNLDPLISERDRWER